MLNLANHLKQVERYISYYDDTHSCLFSFDFFRNGDQHNYKRALPLPHQLLVLNQLSKSLIFALIVHVPINSVQGLSKLAKNIILAQGDFLKNFSIL
jgi:hypothetical protein